MPKSFTTNAQRYFCFTINNPTNDDDKQLDNLLSSISYLCYGREQGKDNTPHYQGYVELNEPQRFSWLKKRLTRAHLEPRKGSRTQARDYCFKEDKDAFEHGHFVADRQGQRNDLVAVQNALDNGVPYIDIVRAHFRSACRYNRFFKKYHELMAPPRQELTKVSVYWGPTGTGKTRAAFAHDNVKQLDYINTFFDDPEDCDVFVFDDIQNPTHLFGRRLFLRMTDRYPMKINIKGGHANWNPKHIIFTTNDDPADWNLDAACRRRITDIVEFVNPADDEDYPIEHVFQ